ncbi:hypothetical protein EBR96_04425 [bacterium]|nr:hypothetical protein [bacterium]
MKERLFSKHEIESRIPHRYENVLLDSVLEQKDETTHRGQLSLNLSNPTDIRRLFTESPIPGTPTIISCTLLEILALASVACTDVPPGYLIIFASISNYKKTADFPVEKELIGSVVKLRDKGGFVRCKGEIHSQEGQFYAEGELMAFVTSPESLDGTADAKKEFELPESNCNFDVNPNWYKKEASMVTSNKLTYWNRETGELISEYTYPLDHPCVKGHFPGRPMMMGIMQMLTIEDACLALSYHENWTSYKKITANAILVRDDGTVIAEVKDATVELNGDGIRRASLTDLKKITFRDPVVPGQKLRTYLTQIRQW